VCALDQQAATGTYKRKSDRLVPSVPKVAGLCLTADKFKKVDDRRASIALDALRGPLPTLLRLTETRAIDSSTRKPIASS
jgi:hypothetical protein